MGKKYPQIQDWGSLREDARECEACDKKASDWVRVATSYMRGDDDSYVCCPRHLGMAIGNVDRFLAHVSTKDKFLNSKSGGAS